MGSSLLGGFGKDAIILTSSGCYNKTQQLTNKQISKKKTFLSVLEAGCPRTRCQAIQGLVENSFLIISFFSIRTHLHWAWQRQHQVWHLTQKLPFSGWDLERRVHTHCVLVVSLFAHAPWGQLRASLVQSRNIPLSQHHQSRCGQIPSHLCLLPS